MTFDQIRNYMKGVLMNAFQNKKTLDKLSSTDGKLVFEDKIVGGDVIDDENISVEKTYSSFKIDSVLNRTEKFAENCNLSPVGAVTHFLTQAPEGWILCDGATLNINEYPELAEAFTLNFGKANIFGGDGVTTFALPKFEIIATIIEIIKDNKPSNVNDQFTITGNGIWSDQYDYWHMFNDGDYCSAPLSGTNNTAWFQLDFKNEITFNNIYITQIADSATDKTFKVEISNDNSSWITVYDGIFMNPIKLDRHYSCKYLKITMSKANASIDYVQIGRLYIKDEIAEYPCVKYKNTMGGTTNSYNNDETVMGTWTNNQPLYRKVIEYTGTFPRDIESGLDMENIEVVRLYAHVKDSVNSFTIPYYDAGFYCTLYINNTTGVVRISVPTGNSINKIYLVVEYIRK